MGHLDAGQALVQLHQHVLHAARARGTVGVLAGVLLEVGFERLVVRGRELRIHRDHIRRGRNVDDGREVLDRVVGRLRVDGRVGGHARQRGDAQVVAIGLLARGLQRTDRTAATAAVVDHDDLAQFLAQGVGNHARNDVGGAAGRERHQQLDGLGRIGLGHDNRACERQGKAEPAIALRHISHLLGFFGLSNAKRCTRIGKVDEGINFLVFTLYIHC
ncbi:hypothetical protein D3C71_1419870 [compost metagenome]